MCGTGRRPNSTVNSRPTTTCVSGYYGTHTRRQRWRRPAGTVSLSTGTKGWRGGGPGTVSLSTGIKGVGGEGLGRSH